MTRILLDADLREKLNGFKEPVEICDEAGKVVARVTPIRDAATYVGREPRLTDEERAERKKEAGPFRTTAEVLKRLESL